MAGVLESLIHAKFSSTALIAFHAPTFMPEETHDSIRGCEDFLNLLTWSLRLSLTFLGTKIPSALCLALPCSYAIQGSHIQQTYFHNIKIHSNYIEYYEISPNLTSHPYLFIPSHLKLDAHRQVPCSILICKVVGIAHHWDSYLGCLKVHLVKTRTQTFCR